MRDRAGVKPLFYYSDNDVFLFGSELKSFHRHPGFKKELSYEGITSFLENGFISAPLTIFKNTNKLGAGEYLILDLQSKKLKLRSIGMFMIHIASRFLMCHSRKRYLRRRNF
ncbi:MAG: hypothetical protein IPH33_17635 [Bacteroidetes bacterium]|nr:hypothetical protein [Bacteroidota bacterium]